MPSVAKAYTNAVVEAGASGMISLLTPTAVSALPASLSTSIPGTAPNGMRLVIGVWGHTATGTIAAAGTAPGSLAAVTETSTTFALAEVYGEVQWYVTTGVFGAVSASGITLGGGLTNGTVVIYGVQTAKSKTLLGETKFTEKYGEFSPVLQRGMYPKDYDLFRTAFDPGWDFSGPLYSDNNILLLQAMYSNTLTYTAIPASPVSILAAATAIATSGSTTTFVTQPTAPGMIVQVILGGTAPATAASVTVTGTNQYGETISEVVVPTTKAQATYNSQYTFLTVTQVAWGAFGTGATMTVQGIFGWSAASSTQETDNLATLALENYDSEGSYHAAYALVDEWDLDWAWNKEAKITAKGQCQTLFPVGDVTNAATQITAVNPSPDEAIPGWQTLIYLDAGSAAFGTTQNLDVISAKVAMKGMWHKPIHTSQWNPPGRWWSRVYRGFYEVDVDLVFDLTATVYQNEYKAWKYRNKRNLRIVVQGPVLGTASGTTYYRGFTLDLPIKWISDATRDFSGGKDSVELTLKGKAYYDSAQGFARKFTWYTRSQGW